MDVEGSREQDYCIQKSFHSVLISRVVLEVQPSNSKNGTKNCPKAKHIKNLLAH